MLQIRSSIGGQYVEIVTQRKQTQCNQMDYPRINRCIVRSTLHKNASSRALVHGARRSSLDAQRTREPSATDESSPCGFLLLPVPERRIQVPGRLGLPVLGVRVRLVGARNRG